MATKRDETEWAGHFRQVGCRDLREYLAWCEANGVRATTRKTPGERRQEVTLFERRRHESVLKAARQFERHPETVLRELANLRMPENARHRPYLNHLYGRFHDIRNSRHLKEAFLRLLLVTHPFKGFQGCDAVIARYAGSLYANALLAMACRHADWVRTPETWTPQGTNPRRLFRDLAAHLFCRYPPPEFLDTAWFAPMKDAARPAQDCFIGVGNGVSLRSLPVPFTLTKRMAHLALTAVPPNCTVEEGWRWAQVLGMGGNERLAQAIIATPLGAEFREEPFWETVVRFFVDNPMLHPSQVGPLVDYLRYERYTPRRAGENDRLPPNFTMKGRTAAALLARMERWHRHLSIARTFVVESWEPSGIAGFTHETRDSRDPERKLRWTVGEITTGRGLALEGRAMSHCVATYAAHCARGTVSVWSLQADSSRFVEPARVMTIAVNRNRAITEARGRRNALPSPKSVRGSSGYARLSAEEERLLSEGCDVVARWAAAEGLSLPSYLTA